MSSTQRILVAFLVILLGVIIRIYFVTHSFSDVVFDAQSYIDFAKQFLQGNYPTDARMKTMGYPLFLAFSSFFTRVFSIEYIKYFQVFLDLCIGGLLWIAGRNIFSRKAADVSFILYILNPFTSSYVGILLPEILSCFVVGLIVALTSVKKFTLNKLYWFLIGLLAGLLVFIKPGMLFFAIGLIGLMSFVSFKKNEIWKFIIVSTFGFLLASSYTLLTNYTYYKKISFTPPYSTVGGQTYIMLFYADRYPEVEFWGVAPELSRIYEEYGSLRDDQIPAWNKYYLRMIPVKFIKDPFVVVSHYVKNLFWLWDKDHLSVYRDPLYPADRYILRAINLILLGWGIIGIIKFIRSKKENWREPIVVVTLVLFGVMSFWFPTVSNESRHTIPFYPILLFWVSYGIWKQKEKFL